MVDVISSVAPGTDSNRDEKIISFQKWEGCDYDSIEHKYCFSKIYQSFILVEPIESISKR